MSKKLIRVLIIAFILVIFWLIFQYMQEMKLEVRNIFKVIQFFFIPHLFSRKSNLSSSLRVPQLLLQFSTKSFVLIARILLSNN